MKDDNKQVVATKTYKPYPWQTVKGQQANFKPGKKEDRNWFPTPVSGNFHLCRQEIKLDTSEPIPRLTISEIDWNGVYPGSPVYSYEETKKCFDLSASTGCTLVEAAIQVKGEGAFSPMWREKAANAPKKYALEKYADPMLAKINQEQKKTEEMRNRLASAKS